MLLQAGVKHVKGSQDSDAIAVSVQLSSNSCMCCLKLERWQQAITAANQVLATEPKNPKVRWNLRDVVANSHETKQMRPKSLGLFKLSSVWL